MKMQMVPPGITAILLLAWLILFPGCVQNSLLEKDNSGGRLVKLNARESRELIEKNNDVVILDVRTPEEFGMERIEGSVNIDFCSHEFAGMLGRLDRDKTYLVYCASGKRAMEAGKLMKRMEFRNILILDGGLAAWKKEGFPLSR